jgi:hypothetical protein
MQRRTRVKVRTRKSGRVDPRKIVRGETLGRINNGLKMM